MRFLVDGNLPRSTVILLRGENHEAEHVIDLGLGAMPDREIAARAVTTQAVLLTRDVGFADIRNYPPQQYPGIVVLRIPDDMVATEILSLLRRFFLKKELVDHVPRHLVILEPRRVRFRPAIG